MPMQRGLPTNYPPQDHNSRLPEGNYSAAAIKLLIDSSHLPALRSVEALKHRSKVLERPTQRSDIEIQKIY